MTRGSPWISAPLVITNIIQEYSPQAIQEYKSEQTFTRFFRCGRLDSVICFVPWGMEWTKDLQDNLMRDMKRRCWLSANRRFFMPQKCLGNWGRLKLEDRYVADKLPKVQKRHWVALSQRVKFYQVWSMPGGCDRWKCICCNQRVRHSSRRPQ